MAVDEVLAGRVREARMSERPMGEDWLDVDASAVHQDQALGDWVEVALRRITRGRPG